MGETFQSAHSVHASALVRADAPAAGEAWAGSPPAIGVGAGAASPVGGRAAGTAHAVGGTGAPPVSPVAVVAVIPIIVAVVHRLRRAIGSAWHCSPAETSCELY